MLFLLPAHTGQCGTLHQQVLSHHEVFYGTFAMTSTIALCAALALVLRRIGLLVELDYGSYGGCHRGGIIVMSACIKNIYHYTTDQQ